MLFNSFEFVLFILVFFAGWPLLKKNASFRWGYLVAASFFFYGWWDWRFLFLILASGFIDFSVETFNRTVGAIGVIDPFPVANLVLPIGISFYTLQSMSRTIDVYRGNFACPTPILSLA